MARTPVPEMKVFLAAFSDEVKITALGVREFVLDLCRDANELIYDNYNALAIGYSLSDKQKDMFCHIAVYSKYVNLGFDHGVDLEDPKGLLKGSGSRIRHVTVQDLNAMDRPYLKKMLMQAHVMKLATLKEKQQAIRGLSVVKSVSAKKKRPQ